MIFGLVPYMRNTPATHLLRHECTSVRAIPAKIAVAPMKLSCGSYSYKRSNLWLVCG